MLTMKMTRVRQIIAREDPKTRTKLPDEMITHKKAMLKAVFMGTFVIEKGTKKTSKGRRDIGRNVYQPISERPVFRL